MAHGWNIEIRNLSVDFAGLKVLENISVTLLAGQITAIIGPNGSGKTTLLRAILSQIPYQGDIRIIDKNPTERLPVIAYVPQYFHIDRSLSVSVSDFLFMDLQKMPVWLKKDAQILPQLKAALAKVGGEHLLEKRLGKLSGGEIQRLLLAKAILRTPDIVLLDEPVSGVDIAGEKLFCDLLEDLQQAQNFTLVMVSHDLSVVSRHAQRVVCINRHLICEGSVTEIITPKTIQQIYGVHMGFHQHEHNLTDKLGKSDV